MTTARKLTRSMAAAALALPLTAAAVAAPAAASTAVLADWRGYPPPGFRGYAASSYAALDTADATAAQSSGLVQVTTDLGAGSGIVVGSDGLVVTNHHVVQGATEVTVTVVTTGAEYAADVVGYDAAKDVAVLQLDDAGGLETAATLPGSLAQGDPVTAVGDAGGDGGTLTAAPGTVTDLHEGVTVQDGQTGEPTRLRNLVEVTSDVVPGDSGGALLDAGGDVVGMTVAASSGTEVNGYVIPIGRVLRVVEQVEAGDESGGVVVGATAFLGVSLAGEDATIAGTVDGSLAQALGLAAGDTVTAVGGTGVSTADGLSEAIAAHEPGDTLTVAWTDVAGAAHEGTTTLVSGPVG